VTSKPEPVNLVSHLLKGVKSMVVYDFTNKTMPGEDDLIRGKQELAEGLKLIFKVFNNYLTTQMIEIAPGDTLWSLAETHLGNGHRWRELYFLNLDRTMYASDVHHAPMSPDIIFAGNHLRVLAF
jgi:hypothetical protein